jgi:hypothetical protein
MLSTDIEQLGANGLAVSLETKLGLIQVALSGTCDRESLPHLAPFLRGLHDEALRLSVRRVVVDCESLYFMNSSAIKCLVTWIGRLKAIPAEHRYSVQFRINKRLAWQQRTLAAVTRFAPDIASLA